MTAVATLLAEAREAHTRYRAASGRITKQGAVSQAPDLWRCGEAVRQALSARIEAQALDPHQSDPAWRADQQVMKGKSQALVDFYVSYLARDVAA